MSQIIELKEASAVTIETGTFANTVNFNFAVIDGDPLIVTVPLSELSALRSSIIMMMG